MSTRIEWAASPDGTPGHVWNPVTGCTKISPGCKNCYAERIHNRRYSAHLAGKKMSPTYHTPFETVVLHDERTSNDMRMRLPFTWRRKTTCFIVSMGDLFHKDVPYEFIDRVLAVVAMTPHIRYVILTKRIMRALSYLLSPGTPDHILDQMIELRNWSVYRGPRNFDGMDIVTQRDDPSDTLYRNNDWRLNWPLRNLVLGCSPCNQETADHDIPRLLAAPAAVRCISAEPLLGPIDISQLHVLDDAMQRYLDGLNGTTESTAKTDVSSQARIDWVIAGGESGPDARPSHPDWFRSLRDQCIELNIPFFFKQWGKHAPPGTGPRILDGVEWNQRPPIFNPTQDE